MMSNRRQSLVAMTWANECASVLPPVSMITVSVSRATLPASAAALAAALAGKVMLDPHTVIMLTGGNTDAESFAKVITHAD